MESKRSQTITAINHHFHLPKKAKKTEGEIAHNKHIGNQQQRRAKQVHKLHAKQDRARLPQYAASISNRDFIELN